MQLTDYIEQYQSKNIKQETLCILADTKPWSDGQNGGVGVGGGWGTNSINSISVGGNQI